MSFAQQEANSVLSTSASLGNCLSFPPPIRAIYPCRVMLCNTMDLLLSVVFSGRSKSSQGKGQLQRWGCQPNITWPICLFFPRRSEDHDILSAQTISRKMVWLKIIISLLERQRQILPSKFYSKNVTFLIYNEGEYTQAGAGQHPLPHWESLFAVTNTSLQSNVM